MAGVAGRAVDFEGKPIAGAVVSVCGFACFGGKSGADGAFRVPLGANLAWNGFSFLVHGWPDHADYVVPLPTYSLEMNVGDLPVPLLPASDTSLPDDGGPGGTITAGPLTLGVPAGTKWDLTFEAIAAGAAGRKLRVAKVPLDKAPPFAAGAVVVLAMGPPSAKPSAKVSVSIDDAGGLPAGTAVELVVMIDDYLTVPNLAGTGRVAALGHVTAEGKVVSDAGEGLSEITWVAIRKMGSP